MKKNAYIYRICKVNIEYLLGDGALKTLILCPEKSKQYKDLIAQGREPVLSITMQWGTRVHAFSKKQVRR